MRLGELDAADLLDVVHVLYEEDATPLWEQHIDVKDRIREVLYPQLYDRPYQFSSTRRAGAAGGGEVPASPTSPDGFPEGVGDDRETKPYIPPSTPEELEQVLGTPMGG